MDNSSSSIWNNHPSPLKRARGAWYDGRVGGGGGAPVSERQREEVAATGILVDGEREKGEDGKKPKCAYIYS